MDWRLFSAVRRRDLLGLQAAVASADFHRVNDPPDPVRKGRMVPPSGTGCACSSASIAAAPGARPPFLC
jgi:hypothetical protein